MAGHDAQLFAQYVPFRYGRPRVRHVDDGRDPTHRRALRAGREVLLVGFSGFAEVDVHVDSARQEDRVAEAVRLVASQCLLEGDDDSVRADLDCPGVLLRLPDLDQLRPSEERDLDDDAVGLLPAERWKPRVLARALRGLHDRLDEWEERRGIADAAAGEALRV